ncbi:MAG: HEAT repeat domain-containing protein [Myxococcota bacterium]
MKAVLGRVGGLLDIHEGEGRLVSLLLAHSFGVGVTRAFTRASGFALFLSEFDAPTLPAVYMGSALVLAAITVVNLRLQQRLAFPSILRGALGGAFLLLVGLFGAHALWDSPLLDLVMPVGYEIAWVLTSLAFWGLAGRLFNVRQGKRLFGLVSSGEWTAEILAGFLVGPLLTLVGTADLLLLGAAGAAGSFGVVTWVVRHHLEAAAPREEPGAGEDEDEDQEEEAPPPPEKGWIRDRYIQVIFGFMLLTTIGYYFVDTAFYGVASAQYPDDEALAAFLGRFFAVFGVLTLVSTSFVARWVLGRYGILAGLLTLPVAVGLGAASVAGIGTFGDVPALVFWCMAGTKLIDMVLRFSVNVSSVLVLYQALPATLRLTVQSTAEGLVQPAGAIIGGAGLLLLTRVLGAGAVELSWVIVGVAAVWASLVVRVRRGYLKRLGGMLARRRFSGMPLALHTPASIDLVKQGLYSRHPGEVIYALDILHDLDPDEMREVLPEMLEHPSPAVRRETLRRMVRERVDEAVPAIERLVETERNPRVKGVALRSLATLGDEDMVVWLVNWLDAAHPDVRLGAMVGLLRSGGIEGVVAAGTHLSALVESEDPRDRAFAARVIGTVGVAGFYRPLRTLLADDDLHVQRVAMTAAGRMRDRRLVPALVHALRVRRTAGSASEALVAIGRQAVPAVCAAFEREDAIPSMRVRLAYVLGRVATKESEAFLAARLQWSENDVRHAILEGLEHCEFEARRADRRRVLELIGDELRRAAWCLTTRKDLRRLTRKVPVLDGALAQEVDDLRERILYLLGFLFRDADLASVRRQLRSADAGQQAVALEVLDNLLSQDLKRRVLPLFDEHAEEKPPRELPAPGQARRLPLGRRQHPSVADRLRAIIEEQGAPLSSWTRACALYAVAEAGMTSLVEVALDHLGSRSELVREMAVFAVAALDPAALEPRLERLCEDRAPAVRAMARSVRDRAPEAQEVT